MTWSAEHGTGAIRLSDRGGIDVSMTAIPARWGAFLVLVGALGATACMVRVESEGYRSVEEQRFSVSDTPEVSLVTFDGSVEVRSWNRPEVFVEVVKRGNSKEVVDAIEVYGDQSGRSISIEARRPAAIGSLFGVDSGSARLVASVPSTCDVIVRSGDGAVSIEGVTGRLELRTEDGRVRGLDLEGDIVVAIGDGSIRLESVDGRLELSSGDGGVNVEGRLTELRVETGDGSIRLRAEPGSLMEGDWDVWTGDGGIVLNLPPGFDANLDAETGDGVVRPGRDVVVLSDASDRSHLEGRIGSGGPSLRLRTAEGSIRVRTN